MGTVQSKRGARPAKPAPRRERRVPWGGLAVATVAIFGVGVCWSGGDRDESPSPDGPRTASAPGMTEPGSGPGPRHTARTAGEGRRSRDARAGLEERPPTDHRSGVPGETLSEGLRAARDPATADVSLWDGRSLGPDTCLRYHAGRNGVIESTTWWCRPRGPQGTLDARMERAFAHRFGGNADVRRSVPWPPGDRKLGARGIVVYWNLRPSGLMRVTISTLDEIPGEEFLLAAGFSL